MCIPHTLQYRNKNGTPQAPSAPGGSVQKLATEPAVLCNTQACKNFPSFSNTFSSLPFISATSANSTATFTITDASGIQLGGKISASAGPPSDILKFFDTGVKQTDNQRKAAAATGQFWPKRDDPLTDAPASLLVVTPGRTLKVVSLGRKTKLPSATAGDPPQEIIVGSLGDFPRGGKLRYLYVKDSFGSVYLLVKSSTIDADYPFTAGKSFTEKDAQDNFPFLCNFMKDKNASYTIVIVPTTIWLPFGHEPPRGDNADTIHCTLESIHPNY